MVNGVGGLPGMVESPMNTFKYKLVNQSRGGAMDQDQEVAVKVLQIVLVDVATHLKT